MNNKINTKINNRDKEIINKKIIFKNHIKVKLENRNYGWIKLNLYNRYHNFINIDLSGVMGFPLSSYVSVINSISKSVKSRVELSINEEGSILKLLFIRKGSITTLITKRECSRRRKLKYNIQNRRVHIINFSSNQLIKEFKRELISFEKENVECIKDEYYNFQFSKPLLRSIKC